MSKNRSKRIHKKLVKRSGGEFRQEPAIYRVGDEIIAHSSFRSQFKETTIDVQMHARYQNPLVRPTWL
jgi:hypothetical protein